MVDFFEIKQVLNRIFGVNQVEYSEDDIIISINMFRENEKIIISNTELQELYNRVSSMEHNGLELYTRNTYEIAVESQCSINCLEGFPFILEDDINGIAYELNYPTTEYNFYLFMMIIDMWAQKKEEKSFAKLFQNLKSRIKLQLFRRGDNATISLQTMLQAITGVLSLQIKNKKDSPKKRNEFENFKTSFLFDFMYKTGIDLVDVIDIVDVLPIRISVREKFNSFQIDTPPLRNYNKDVVDYYKQALESYDPYIKFISFYHVMEYFYDEVFKRKLVTDLKAKITHPDFSYKDEDKMYEMALFVKNRLRMNDETGHGNELESLKYVLREYVTGEEIKKRIGNLDKNTLNYYQNNKVNFCNAPIINWSDSEGVFTQIAKRIYFTRNALVHSKSGKNKERYYPYRDKKQLQREIPLVQAIAEAIIINSSEII